MAKVHSLLKNPLGGHFRLRRGTKYDDFGPLEPDLGLLSAHYQLNADFFNRLSSLGPICFLLLILGSSCKAKRGEGGNRTQETALHRLRDFQSLQEGSGQF